MNRIRFFQSPCPILFILLFTVCLSYTSISAENRHEEKFFEQSILPILKAHCIQCHSSQAKNQGLNLTSPTTIFAGRARRAVIQPGNPNTSLLYQLIQADGKPHMPPQGQLTQKEIASTRLWIASLPSSQATQFKRQFSVTDRQHWADQPIHKPNIPDETNVPWVKTPIDAFIWQQLQSKKLQPSPLATKLTWIRRATFDLTGLPPTPTEIQNYIENKSPQADTKVIDRLLASSTYGESGEDIG